MSRAYAPVEGEGIVYVSRDDDPDSVLARLRRTGAAPVLLVVGHAGSPMARPTDIKRLALQLRDYPRPLTVVSSDRAVRSMALAEGVKVAVSLDGKGSLTRALQSPFLATRQTLEALSGSSRTARYGGSPARTLANILLGPVLLAALLGTLAWAFAFVLYPSDDVVLYPATLARSVEFDAVADPSVKVVDPAAALIPARIADAEAAGTRRAPSTGMRQEPAERASGAVELRNLTAASITVPGGTGLLSASGQRYLTAADVLLPAAARQPEGAEPSGLELAVVAAERGAQANAPQDAVSALEGPLRFSIAVVRASPMTGGTDREAAYVTGEDRRRLRAELLAALMDDATARLQSQQAPGELLQVWPAGALSPTIVDATFDADEGVSAREFELRMSIKLFGTVFNKADARDLVIRALEGRTRQGDPEFLLASETVLTPDPEIRRVVSGELGLKLTGSATAVRRIDLEAVRRAIVDVTPDEARSYLRALPDVRDFDFRHSPGFSRRTSRFQFRINVAYEAGGTGSRP